ncbi:MAG: sugar nucleotide-binding protein, partial [Candidatus Omnitrophica bacterium]|nr:sugar nucleotide-binding protein [Candidatus Omnitrophota bacterium]
FVYKIVQQLKQGKKEILAVSDKFGTPTFTRDFAANLIDVINCGQYGIYHMANKGTCTRYDMAVKIVESMGLDREVKVTPVCSDRFPLPAPRARSEMIENYNLESIGLNNMPYWQDSLDEYIRANKDKKMGV